MVTVKRSQGQHGHTTPKIGALFLKLREREEQERHGLSTKGAAGVLGESSFSAVDT